MRKLLIPVSIILLCLIYLFLRQPVLRGTDELTEKARQELPLANAETVELQYAGMCVKGDNALIWFISGNEHQSHYYLPMGCGVVGRNAYIFLRCYTPMERGEDIAVLQWNDGYAFLINNPQCAVLQINGQDIDITSHGLPYLHYTDYHPSVYRFLDADGNELPIG